MHYFETHSVDPAYNLAFEEYILTHHTQGDILILWQNDNTIVVGQNQNTLSEINQDFVKEQGIHVVRRMTGGGAVYHDMANLNYSFITDVEGSAYSMRERFTKPIIETLAKLGVEAYASGKNDILIDGRKISGTAQRVIKDRILHHGTLLFDVNPFVMEHALKVSETKLKARGVNSVKARVGRIKDYLKETMTIQDFWEFLKVSLTQGDFVQKTMKAEEIEAILSLKKSKYDTLAWNYGKETTYDKHKKSRYAGGEIEIGIDIKENRIENLQIYGDFMAQDASKDLIETLLGCTYTPDSVQKKLEGIDLEKYLGEITKEEFLETMF